MSRADALEEIWAGDHLGRRHEAEFLEAYLVREISAFERHGRSESIVLGIDAPYGRCKTWFLDRLARQLELSHPVARIDAWADDAGDEPLTAFMAAIEDALSPYLTTSKTLRDRLAATRAAALPVVGKLVSGALVKALSKVAGDEIEDQLGTTIEDAVRGAKTDREDTGGAAAAAMEAAFEKLGNEIDSLVDRRGAAMLSAYRQRKRSREQFRINMRDLVASIDGNAGHGSKPLVVVVGELDRCRPNYAIRMLEEIKHFFDVPGVVFVLGLHGGQLSKSIKAVYGAEFDTDDYLRRFFTRRYELRRHSIVELVASTFEEWKLDENIFRFPEVQVNEGYPLTKPRLIGLILAQWNVYPREIMAIMDGLRLFCDCWEHPEPIEPLMLLGLLIHLVRGERLDTAEIASTRELKFKGWVYVPGGGADTGLFEPNDVLRVLSPLAWNPLSNIDSEHRGRDPARNYLLEWLRQEKRDRAGSGRDQSHLADYIPRLSGLARFIDKPA